MRAGIFVRAIVGVAVAALLVVRAAAGEPMTRDKVMAALPALQQLAWSGWLARTAFPGCRIAVVYRDEVVFLKGFGVREAGKSEPVDADTVFQIASASKSISGHRRCRRPGQRDGALTWDTRIADIDPGFKLQDAHPTAV